MNAYKKIVIFLAVAMIICPASARSAHYSGHVTIRPSSPSAVPWERTLQPLETASFSVTVINKESGYCLISGPSFSITGNGNVLWTGGPTSFYVSNESRHERWTQAEVTCVWTPCGEGGGEGEPPEDITGHAVGRAELKIADIVWETNPDLQAIGGNSINWVVKLVDEYGQLSYVPTYFAMSSQCGYWEIQPEGGNGPQLSGAVQSTQWSKNCLRVDYSYFGRTRYSESPELTFVEIEKMQYRMDGTWADVPDVIYACAGTNVSFKVLPLPPDAGWPEGKPVWTGASGSGSELTETFSQPGTNLVTAECGNTVTAKVFILSVEFIDASSSEEGSSANVPPFEGHKPWPFDVTKSPDPDKHMVVFYKDVVDSSFNVDDFDVDLEASVLPSSITHDQLNEVWSKIDGPGSGSFDRTDTFEIKYQNPKEGGVYRFDFDLGLSGCAKSEANVVLPLAGAEIDSIVQADITRADSFATTVRANYSWIERQHPWNGTRWFVTAGAGDYLGRPDHSSSPTVWVYNQVNTSSSFGMGAVGTWKGKPVRVAKVSNFMVGYAANKIGVDPVFAWMSQVIGTFNDSAASKSWDAGWDIADGDPYNTTVTALVADIWDDADDKNQKLWPNTSAANNHVAPNSFYDPDTQFTSPGFLYMSNP